MQSTGLGATVVNGLTDRPDDCCEQCWYDRAALKGLLCMNEWSVTQAEHSKHRHHGTILCLREDARPR